MKFFSSRGKGMTTFNMPLCFCDAGSGELLQKPTTGWYNSAHGAQL